jgi:hypothetical protein
MPPPETKRRHLLHICSFITRRRWNHLHSLFSNTNFYGDNIWECLGSGHWGQVRCSGSRRARSWRRTSWAPASSRSSPSSSSRTSTLPSWPQVLRASLGCWGQHWRRCACVLHIFASFRRNRAAVCNGSTVGADGD